MFQHSLSAAALAAALMAACFASYPNSLLGQTKAQTKGRAKAAAKTRQTRPVKKPPRSTGDVPSAGEASTKTQAAKSQGEEPDNKPIRKTDREWKRLLTPKQYRVTRQKETELPFTGSYVHTKKEGVYRCVCCGAELFRSDTKFDSGTGWPSFYAPLRQAAVATAPDYSDGGFRVEVTCARCAAHLGHVFNDGPEPTGLRYCINSVSLKLKEAQATAVDEKPAQGRSEKGK